MNEFADIADAVAASAPVVVQAVPVVPGRRIHIDADILAYQCGGNEDTDVATSRRILGAKINLLREAAGAERIQLHMTGAGSTKGDRALVAVTKPYQGQRKGDRPKNWGYLRDYMAEGLAGPIKQWFDREADDGFGFVSKHEPGAVIATRDKDMRMLPGLHLTWDTYELVEVPPGAYSVEHGGKVYGPKWFWLQMLHGDTADNIPNLVRGWGEVKAMKALADTSTNGEGCHTVIKLFKEQYGDGWADRFVESAILLWMRRDTDGSLLEFIRYLPSMSDVDGKAVGDAATTVRRKVEEMKEQAACLSD